MILIGILKFIFCSIAVFFTCMFILSSIVSIINPQIGLDKDGKAVEQGDKPRLLFAIIMAVAWGLLAAL